MTANLEVLPDPEALATRAADLLTSIAAAKPRAAIALSGGSTPRRLYQLLATSPRLETFPWPNVHWFWGDERFVPPDDPASNYRMTREAMLSRALIPADHVHPMPTVGKYTNPPPPPNPPPSPPPCAGAPCTRPAATDPPPAGPVI